MQAYVDVPAPEGLTDDVMGRGLYELNKLGTIENGPYGGSPVEVFMVPDEDKPAGAPPDLPFVRLVANLIPYV